MSPTRDGVGARRRSSTRESSPSTSCGRSRRDTRRRFPTVFCDSPDPDEDHHVSRDEALLFLQQQLGVVWLSKLDPWEAPPVDEDALFVKRGLYRIVPLRQRDGKLVDFARFLRIDRNRDNEIDKSEYVGRQPSFGSTGRSFDAQDRDGDGRLSVAEFGRPGGPNLFDLLGWFRSADTDLDALLSPEEMDAASIGLRKNLVGSSFSGFDTDDDGRLSLREYRLTMHASLNYPWTVLPRDSDRDQQISFAEFRFGDRDAFHLQRWFFFHRLDDNGDGKLSPREFRFRSPGRTTVQLFSNDGRRSRIVFEAAAGELGGASLAADGKALLLHQSSRDDHGQLNQARIVLLDLETGKLTPLLDGALPSWSPSEARFVCERGDQRRSIWMVDRDGGQRELVDGFAPEWSPDGQSIAFFQQAYRSLMLLNPATGNVTTVIGPEDHEYQFFWRNMAWSPDGKRLALRGDARNRSDLLVVDLEQKPSFRVRLSGNVPLGPEFVWSPNGRRLLFQMRNPLERRDQWHELDPAGAGPAKVVEAFDNGLSPKTGCFTPNGEWYISVSKH